MIWKKFSWLLGVITDKFGCRLYVDDWILYVPVDPLSGQNLKYGQVQRFSGYKRGNLRVIQIKDSKDYTTSERCVKFSQEEYVVRKLQSE